MIRLSLPLLGAILVSLTSSAQVLRPANRIEISFDCDSKGQVQSQSFGLTFVTAQDKSYWVSDASVISGIFNEGQKLTLLTDDLKKIPLGTFGVPKDCTSGPNGSRSEGNRLVLDAALSLAQSETGSHECSALGVAEGYLRTKSEEFDLLDKNQRVLFSYTKPEPEFYVRFEDCAAAIHAPKAEPAH